MAESKNNQLKVSFFMKDCLNYIIRNYEEISKTNETHINKDVPHSFSTGLLRGFIENEIGSAIATEDFWGALFEMSKENDAEVLMFVEYAQSDFPQLKNLKVRIDLSKNTTPSALLRKDVLPSESAEDSKVISFTILSETMDGKIIDLSEIPTEIIQGGAIMLIPNPEYLSYLHERDETLIQAELQKQEEKLRKEMKETGRLSSAKSKTTLKLG